MPYEHEAGQLRKIARRGTIFYTDHAETERRKDQIEKIDIANMLSRCRVTLVETNKSNGEEEWRAEEQEVVDFAFQSTAMLNHKNCQTSLCKLDCVGSYTRWHKIPSRYHLCEANYAPIDGPVAGIADRWARFQIDSRLA